MNIQDLIKICSDPETDHSFLEPLISGYKERSYSHLSDDDKKIVNAITLNPSISKAQLCFMLMRPNSFRSTNLIKNPIFELVLLEDPDFINTLHETAIKSLLEIQFETYYKTVLDKWFNVVIESRLAWQHVKEIFELVKTNEIKVLKLIQKFYDSLGLIPLRAEIFKLYPENKQILKQLLHSLEYKSDYDLADKISAILHKMSPLGVAEDIRSTAPELAKAFQELPDWKEESMGVIKIIIDHPNCSVDLYKRIVLALIEHAEFCRED